MRRILLTLILWALPGYSQTAPSPSTITLHTIYLDPNGSIVGSGPFAGAWYYGQGPTPPIKSGFVGVAGPTDRTLGYMIHLPAAVPTVGQSLEVSTVPSTGRAYLSWVSGGVTRTVKAGACTFTIVNGRTTAVTGC